MTTHREISVHCHGRLPEEGATEDTVRLPRGVRVVMMNAGGGTLCGGGASEDDNAPKFDGICVTPETFDPRFRDWMRADPPDAETGLRNFAELMTQLRTNSVNRWCVLENTEVPNLRLYCNDRLSTIPFGAYTHPFAVNVEYTDLDGASRVASIGAPEAIAALQYPLDDSDDDHFNTTAIALGHADIALMVAFEDGRVKRIELNRSNSFRPTPTASNLAALLAELGADREHRNSTVNIYLFVCAGDSPRSAGRRPAFHRVPGVTPLAHWLPPSDQSSGGAVRAVCDRQSYHHPYRKK